MKHGLQFGNIRSFCLASLGGAAGSEAVSSTTDRSAKAVPFEIARTMKTNEAGSGRPGRISALDFTKGTLVLVMVLYHWLNYFVGPQGSFYRYLSFLPPSFICITGFLIAQVYLSKSGNTAPHFPRRIMVRGLKLLLIFILLNIGIGLLIPGTRYGRGFLDHFSRGSLESVFLTGNMMGGRTVAFYVLVPISYLLLLSALLLIAYPYFQHLFHAVTCLCLLAIFVLFMNGSKSGNLELMTIGLLGVSIGHIPVEKINLLLRHPFALAVAYLCYEAAITVWNVPYPLQVIGVLLTLMVIYLTGTAAGDTGRVQRWLILLGKYSLFGYISQIAILQVLRRGLGMEPEVWVPFAALLAAVFLTILSVEALDLARSKLAFVNRLYAAVFM